MTNVFAQGDSAAIIELIASVIADPDAMAESDKDWAFRAFEFLEAFIPAMVWKRDSQSVYLDARSLYGAMAFEPVIDLAGSVSVPKDLRLPLSGYLENLHGFSDIKTYAGTDESFLAAKQQHGYRVMLLYKPMSYLNGEQPLDFVF